MKIYFAPLEGITGYIYRNAYEKVYGGIDKYFAPFISPSDKCPMTNKGRKDILPENNSGINLVPQLLTCKAEHFNEALDELKDLGYKEVNLNIGCPSGTVCAKGKGAGFLRDTDALKDFLEDILESVIICLGDCILCSKPEILLCIKSICKASFSKTFDRIIEIVHTLCNTC